MPTIQQLVRYERLANKKKTKSILDTKYKFNPNEIEEIKIIPIRRYL